MRVSVSSGFVVLVIVLGAFVTRLIVFGPVQAGERMFRSQRLHSPTSAAFATAGLVAAIVVLAWCCWRLVRHGGAFVVSRVHVIRLGDRAGTHVADVDVELRRNEAVKMQAQGFEVAAPVALRVTLRPDTDVAEDPAAAQAECSLEPRRRKARIVIRPPGDSHGMVKMRIELTPSTQSACSEVICKWWKSIAPGDLSV